MSQRFLRLKEVQKITGLPCSSLYALIKKNEFPRQVPLSACRVGWIEEEVFAWQKARIAARDQAA